MPPISATGRRPAFLDHALFLGLLGLILGYATMNRVPRRPTSHHLLTILLTFLLIPLALALPVQALVPGLGFGRAYFEMLSCLTTTGATLLDRVRLLPEPPASLAGPGRLDGWPHRPDLRLRGPGPAQSRRVRAAAGRSSHRPRPAAAPPARDQPPGDRFHRTIARSMPS